MNWWVGVLKVKHTGHEVFSTSVDPEPEKYPQYDYVIGPFADKTAADKRAATEINGTGMFHAYPGHPR